MTLRLAGKPALLTAAGQGVGYAAALAFEGLGTQRQTVCAWSSERIDG